MSMDQFDIDALGAHIARNANQPPASPAPFGVQDGQGGLTLPTNDEVYAEVCRQREGGSLYVSTNAINDTMAAIRAILARQTAPTVGSVPKPIKPIRTKEDHAAALGEVMSLMNVEPGTPESERLEVLAVLVEDYEANHFPLSAAPQEQAAERAAVPEGFVLMPKRLTAENGAKSALSCEFHEHVAVECPECLGDGDDSYGEDCPECNGEGKVAQRVTVEWDTIKRIYDKAVELLAAAPVTQEGKAADGWISVKDRKPESGIAVLVIAEGWERPCVAAYFKKSRGIPAHWQDEHGDNLWPPVPTYWTPLPKLPAQQTSAQVDAPEGGA